jgi:hypothetical protein
MSYIITIRKHGVSDRMPVMYFSTGGWIATSNRKHAVEYGLRREADDVAKDLVRKYDWILVTEVISK